MQNLETLINWLDHLTQTGAEDQNHADIAQSLTEVGELPAASLAEAIPQSTMSAAPAPTLFIV